MKTSAVAGNCLRNLCQKLARAFLVAGVLLCTNAALAQLPPGGGGGPTYTPLDSWSFFYDNTNWTSDKGFAPISFTNLGFSYLGDGASLVVDTNVPAWLNYNVVETNGTTNLTVDAGTVTFWFAPDWASTNLGGTGPGEYGRLLEVGGYTPDSSYGWWSLYVDDVGANIYFSTQTNDLSSNVCTYLSFPIAWTNDYFHFIALTYSATNTTLYLDGVLATNGPPMTNYPGAGALANGFFIGSDSNGVFQAHGMFNNLYTYNVPMDADTIQETFNQYFEWYMMNPYNTAMEIISSANSTPSNTPSYDAITGQGNLQLVGSASSCSNGTNAYNIWITNVTAQAMGNGIMKITFAIEGGSNGIPYDVFANSVLSFGPNGVPWAWEGQGTQCNVYSLTITNTPNLSCFIILGTPQDSDYDGLTDAYKELVSHIDPNNPDPAGDGIADSDKVLMSINPLTVVPAFPASLNIQTCPQ
jgi:hypothetical protein